MYFIEHISKLKNKVVCFQNKRRRKLHI